ncbi:hypothetical protein D5F01_LYC17891 [Larimichthys crocea]|uniref:Uncharacterized protein n=2 Tax=Larimichthys crocea TaxID=215358 RepID=A0ACD3RQU7_LARCR|nr:uncharacterized protein LOC104935517 [Larimichthys crocea]KAE8284558.1 hypothetical protein D5F01_LYC17891 [Larimichthys crocea]TMS21854.1 hypothetical protein E3U43_012119 [Larimichthys crocea]
MMAPELLTVIVASVSCIAFCLVIFVLVVVFYRKEPLCCRFRPHRTEHYTDDSPHYHSRHSLIGVARNEHSAAMNQGAVGPQLPGRLFIIGKPNDYHLSEALPRLPSYESVRKKDRQRQIHSLISQRFGLSGYNEEPPPTYEETVRHSLEISPVHLHSLDVRLSVHSHDHSSYLSEDTHINPRQPSSALQGASSSYCPAESSRFLSI